ncbi:D-Ala-D-Ala carboxypeptidase family metallohydrolase [uncultured Bacteroides sp.]|uniref:D-Ala-D-Ala carboxypeptidase family metallohydrolase n=1 Tax=uncultured Bacteroides sp. TaxID=162156 RepID=UPI0026346124|nr:D-Ala-D-Ala carboxypeptidase family metallohydrolase [uncultured Bacteroides sp.]
MGMFFTIGELCRSDVALNKGIKNEPNLRQKMNMEKLIDNVLDPLRSAYRKPIYVNSGFRSLSLNKILGGAKNSQHMEGKAADIQSADKKDNLWLFEYIRDNLEFDQLINEKPDKDGIPQWIHVSYNEDNNRNQVLTL